MNEKTYKQFIVDLIKDENFDILITDIKDNLLRQIASTLPEETAKREALYHKIQGVDAVKKGAVLAAKRKVTGGTD